LEVNSPARAALFKTSIPAGAKVLDLTVPPLRADGTPLPKDNPNETPYVHYVQPAQPHQLDEVVHAAQLETGAWLEQIAAERRKRRLWYWGAAALAGFTVGLLILRLRARRRNVTRPA
jgi:hypothetical protein